MLTYAAFICDAIWEKLSVKSKYRLNVSFLVKIGFLLNYYSITSCLSSLNISWENSLV